VIAIAEDPSVWAFGPTIAGLGAALGGVGLFLSQRWIVFKPSRQLAGEPLLIGCTFENVFLRLDGGVNVHGWWIPRERSTGLILFLPGSIGNISHELTTLAFLLDTGASLFIIDYPGFGKSGGRPSERGCYLAAAAAWDFAIGKAGRRPEDIVIFGRSLGGTVAAWLAARHENCRGLVVHSGASSVPDLAADSYPFFPVRYFCYMRFNTLRYIGDCRCPVLVLHPTEDSIIPISHGNRIFREACVPKRFTSLRGDHYGSEWQRTPGLLNVLAELISGEARAWT
jgi:uncharacterized protein